MIPVTKPYLPDRAKLERYVDGIYERNWLTNNGPLLQELTSRLEGYLGVENLLLVSNGTLALQIAYHSLGIHEQLNNEPPEAVTTPFTFVATAGSLTWEGIQPVFTDIDPDSWCMAPENIERAITPQTRAIVPVHVFGNACEVEAIQAIAEKKNLKVIYDAAHAFGVNYKGSSLLKWGDAATLSFHATKVFHTIEGGAIIFKRREDLKKAKALVNFGITGPDEIGEFGINAKMNEFSAAMGLCVLDEMESNQNARASVWDAYYRGLQSFGQLQAWSKQATQNHAYFPIALKNEQQLQRVLGELRHNGVLARRYFYPSLDRLPKMQPGKLNTCSKSQDLADRIICLPLYAGIEPTESQRIIHTIKSTI
jgi:dTDP-4-amino-4,6-dideoxygalactose transaminase